MKIFKLDDDKYLVYSDDGLTQEVSKSELVDQLSKDITLPLPSNDELLEWAKHNHPIVKNNEILRASMQDKQDLLDAINAL